ncbi:phosphonoacetaldehyde hydrolase, partial [Acinetobacter baumannii]
MGRPKRDHIAALLALPRIGAAWAKAQGRVPTEADIDLVYQVFVPTNVKVAADFAELVPGAAAIVKALRARGLK